MDWKIFLAVALVGFGGISFWRHQRLVGRIRASVDTIGLDPTEKKLLWSSVLSGGGVQ